MKPNQNVPPAAPANPSMPEEKSEPAPNQPSAQVIIPKKRTFPKALMAVIFFILILGIGSFIFLRGRDGVVNGPETTTPEHVFEEFPDFPGIPINDSTISFVKADGKFCLLYKGVIYLPQDSGVLVPKSQEETEEMAAFPWIGLVDAPGDINGTDEVFSFKDSPSNNSFVFITRWETSSGESYHMYRFFNNNISELRIFRPDNGLFYVPKLNLFSLGGNFLNLSMFRCPECLTEQPETMLYYIPTGDTRNIGKVSHFEWSEDDNVYKYKQY